MERLTEWIDDGEHRQTIPKTDIRSNGHNECCNKLATYEDLEEQGLLVRLPCKLYHFYGIDLEDNFADATSDEIIMEVVVTEFIIDSYKIAIKCITGWNGSYEYLPVTEFGKTVFLTREEAVNKLEEMKNGKK